MLSDNGTIINWLVWVSVFIVVATAVMFLVLIMQAVHRRSRFVIQYRRPRNVVPFHRPALADGLERVKCPYCSGSAQWLHPETGWGKIPRHMLFRRWNREEQDFDCGEPIHANIRRCPHCAGLGSTYREREERT